MKLNSKDKAEIQTIADSLPDSELEIIGARADEMMKQHKSNPLIAPACAFLTRHFDYPVIGMFDLDDKQEEAAETFLRDMMVRALKRERGIEIWRAKHSFDEVA